MQLVTEQRVIVVKIFYKTSSYFEVKKPFRERFLEKDPLTNRTIWNYVKKYEREGISLNINKERSGSGITVRTEETIEVVRVYVGKNTVNISCSHNGLGLSCCTFDKITKEDLK